jgi:hypothetical protein
MCNELMQSAKEDPSLQPKFIKNQTKIKPSFSASFSAVQSERLAFEKEKWLAQKDQEISPLELEAIKAKGLMQQSFLQTRLSQNKTLPEIAAEIEATGCVFKLF